MASFIYSVISIFRDGSISDIKLFAISSATSDCTPSRIKPPKASSKKDDPYPSTPSRLTIIFLVSWILLLATLRV